MKLISIIGMSRTGTSWLGKILASHPETLYHFEPFDLKNERMSLPGSLRFWDAVENACKKRRQGDVQGARDILWKALERFWTVKNHALDRKPLLPQNASPLATMVIKDPALVPVADLMGYFGGVILIVRDPRGQINSLLNHTRFGSCYGIQSSAERWAIHGDEFMRLVDELPETYTLIRYEDLAQAPKKAIKPVLDKYGLGWEVEVGKFIEQSRSGHDPDPYGVIKDAKRVEAAWRRGLSAGAQRTIVAAVKDSRIWKELYHD